MDELIDLEQRIKHKIAYTKDKMHKTMERAVTVLEIVLTS